MSERAMPMALVKSNPIKDGFARYEWKKQQERCACCWRAVWRTYSREWVWYEVHHLIKPGRSDEPCNWLFLCNRCHLLAEGNPRVPDDNGGYWPVLTLGHCLWFKREANHDEWNPQRLEALLHRKLPAPHKPPDVLFKERRDPNEFSNYILDSSTEFGKMTVLPQFVAVFWGANQ